MFTRKQLCWTYFLMNTEKVLRADFLWLSLKRGTGNGEWEMRLTIFHEILHSEQFEDDEFIDDNIVFWDFWHLPMLAPVIFQAIVLDKEQQMFHFDEISYSTQSEGGEFNSGNSFLWFSTPVSIGTCYLLGHGFRPKTTNAPVLMKFFNLHKTRVLNSVFSILRDAINECRRGLKLGIEKQILCQK